MKLVSPEYQGFMAHISQPNRIFTWISRIIILFRKYILRQVQGLETGIVFEPVPPTDTMNVNPLLNIVNATPNVNLQEQIDNGISSASLSTLDRPFERIGSHIDASATIDGILECEHCGLCYAFTGKDRALVVSILEGHTCVGKIQCSKCDFLISFTPAEQVTSTKRFFKHNCD